MFRLKPDDSDCMVGKHGPRDSHEYLRLLSNLGEFQSHRMATFHLLLSLDGDSIHLDDPDCYLPNVNLRSYRDDESPAGRGRVFDAVWALGLYESFHSRLLESVVVAVVVAVVAEAGFV